MGSNATALTALCDIYAGFGLEGSDPWILARKLRKLISRSTTDSESESQTESLSGTTVIFPPQMAEF